MDFKVADSKNETASQPADNNRAIDSLQSTLSNLEFEKARNFARNGEYNQAKIILEGILQRGPNSIVMDLLARIYAQQGQLDKARYFWEKAILLDPQNIDFIKALEFISKTQSQKTRVIKNWKSLFAGFGSLVILALIGLLIFQVTQFQNLSSNLINSNATQLFTNSGISIQENTSDENLLMLGTMQVQIESQYNNLDSKITENQVILDQLSTITTDLSAVDTILSIPTEFSIDVPGTTVKIEGSKAMIRFDNRLFLYGDEFSNNGEEMLLQVGEQLEPWLGKIQINVVGFTDSLESNKIDLPLDRSNATVKYLVNHTRLPVSIFTITSGDGQPSPFPPNSTGDLYRERTVLLEISFLPN